MIKTLQINSTFRLALTFLITVFMSGVTLAAEDFDEQFEKATSKQACNQITSTCGESCNNKSINSSISIIASGGRRRGGFNSDACYKSCNEGRDACWKRLDEEASEAREQAAEARERSAIASKAPLFTLACGRYQVRVWENGCGIYGPNLTCSISPARIRFVEGNYVMAINRVTGILERYQYADQIETIQCQKATAETTKF